MTPTAEQWERALPIEKNAPGATWLSLACALLTSPLKTEREQGKTMVREWKRGTAQIQK